MKNVMDFPMLKQYEPAPVDWDRIEALRQQQYPQIPVETVEIIRRIRRIETGVEKRADWSLEINIENCFYPPHDIECSLNTADIVWIMDLLDRFGGELLCGKMNYKIVRFQARPPAFWINRLDPISFQGIESNSEFRCEHYCEAKTRWRILGKKMPDSDLIMVIIRFLDDEGGRYIGFIDKTTFTLLLDRIEEGTPIENAFMLDEIG